GRRAVLRTLAPDRCPDLADLGEAGGLLDGDVDLRLLDVQAGVVASLGADRRVGVEAVEPQAGIGLGADRRPGAVGRHGGRVEAPGARVVGEAGPAEPRGAGRGRPWRGRIRRRRSRGWRRGWGEPG